MKCKNCWRDLNPKPDTIMIVCPCGETNEVQRQVKGGDEQ